MIDHCRIARSTLRLSSSKNEGGSVYLCQNSVAFMLPTTTTSTTVYSCTSQMYTSDYGCARIYFSCFNTSLSPSSYFTAKCFFACVNQLKVTCLQLKWKQRRRKEVNFWPVGFEIQLLEMTFKPVNIVDRNVVRQAVCFARKIQALILKLCFSGAVTCWKPTPMPSPFTRASWPCLSSSTFPWLLLWTPASTPKVMQSLVQLHLYVYTCSECCCSTILWLLLVLSTVSLCQKVRLATPLFVDLHRSSWLIIYFSVWPTLQKRL